MNNNSKTLGSNNLKRSLGSNQSSTSGSQNKQLIFLKCFLLFLGIELIWAIGTANWGNAIRHHVPGLPIIIILFSISLKNIYEKFSRS